MTLILRNHEMRGLLPLSDYIDAVEQGYHDMGSGRGSALPRTSLWIPGEEDQAHAGGHLKPGSRGSFKVKGAWLARFGGGVQPYTAGLPAGLQTFMFLFDQDGALAAIMEVLYYDWLKTGAVGAVAAKHLAPEGSRTVALFGTGRHARTQLHGLLAVHPIEQVRAYSRRPAPRAAFCHQMSEELGIAVTPVESPKEALEDADIIVTITNSPAPVFDGRLLPERPVHINAMGAHYPWVREIDAHVVTRSRLILDEWEQGLSEQGELLIPMAEGLLDKSVIAGDLAQVVTAQVAGRTSERPWTLFLSGGTGIEDVAVAARLYEAAREQGVGTHVEFGLPYQWVL